MKLETIVQAAHPLQKLILQDMPLHTAYKLSKLIGKLNPLLEFYGAEMAKQPEEDKRHELLELDIEGFEDFCRLHIAPDLPLVLSAADIKCLEPFINFEKDDGP